MGLQNYRHLKKQLPSDAFKPYPRRLLFLFTIQVLAIGSIISMVAFTIPWFLKLGLSVLVGYCWALSGLIGHELMHGSIVRSKKWQNFLGFFCFQPFLISPTFWRHWHNNLHHSYTQKIIMDPDAYPTYRIYKQSRFIQWMYKYTPGSGYLRSYLYFFFWFTFNAQVAQYYFRFRNKIFDKVDHKRVNLELLFMNSVFITTLYLVGVSNWIWVFVLPYFVMNYLPFSYISTNHNLSPLTSENDPLVNSLTVTNHPVLEYFHINFGYHTEHHLYPTLSGVYLKDVHELLKVEYPEKFQYMPKWKAMKALYNTARIYKNSKTLMNPLSGDTYPVIMGEEKAKPKETSTVSDQLSFETVLSPNQQQPDQTL